MAKYYKDTREGKENHIWSMDGAEYEDPNCESGPDYALEIDEDEFRLKMKDITEELKLKTLIRDPIVDPDGFVELSDIDKLYFWDHGHKHLLNINGEVDATVQSFITAIDKSLDIPPTKMHYNSILDKYICNDGEHRSLAYYKCNKRIPYIDKDFSARLEFTRSYIEGYKEELELIELGGLDSTTLTETQYKELLKLRNQWRKELDE